MNGESVKGHWVAPGFVPVEGLPGVLTIEPAGRCKLNLIGAFKDEARSGGRDDRDIPIIQGRDLHGQEYTLLDGWIRRNISGFGGPYDQIVGAVRVLTGIHLARPDDAVFTTATVELENLATWVGAIEYSLRLDKESSKQTVELPKPETVEFQHDGLTYRVRTSVGFFNHRLTRSNVEIASTTGAFLEIESPTPLPADGFDAAVSSWVDLLTFATAEPCAIRSFRLRHTDDEVIRTRRYVDNDDGTKSPEPVEFAKPRQIEMHCRWSAEQDTDPLKPVKLHDFAFLRGERPVGEWFAKWMKLREQSVDALNTLLSLTYGSNTFIQADLLIVATCAEALHRGLHPKCLAMQPRDFEKMMDAATAKLEDEDAAKVRGAIRNEPSYKQRLLDLLRMLPEKVIEEALIRDPEAWAQRVTATRNGLAHGLRKTDSELDSLYITYERTRLVLELVIMSELGVDEERLQMYAVEHRVFD